MKVVFLTLSALAFAHAGNVGFPSSYSSLSGPQYHPEGWSDSSANAIYGVSSSSAYEHAHKSIYPEHIPVIQDGVPTETPEVQAAKAHFYSEYNRAASLAAQKPDPLDGQYAEELKGGKYLPLSQHGWTGAENRVSHGQTSQIWENSNAYNQQQAYNHNDYVPVDTPEVQEAKAAHFQAYSSALSRASAQKQYHRYRRSASEWAQPKYQGPIHVPQITANGVPADTVEVQKARLIHHQALNQAAALAHSSGQGEEHNSWNEEEQHGQSSYGAGQSAGWTATPTNVAYKIHHDGSQKWHGPQHIPTLDHNGVPIDTPEVQHARKVHLAALAQESLKHKGWTQTQQGWQKAEQGWEAEQQKW